MTNSATLFDTWNLIAAVTVASLLLMKLADWLRARAYTQKIAAQALHDHFEVVDRIIDDPALPHRIAAFVAAFSEVVADKEASKRFYGDMVASQGEKVRDSGLTDELALLARTRPDLTEGVLMAVSKGLLAMLYRPSPSIKEIEDFLSCLATEPRREIQVASKYVALRRGAPLNMVAA